MFGRFSRKGANKTAYLPSEHTTKSPSPAHAMESLDKADKSTQPTNEKIKTRNPGFQPTQRKSQINFPTHNFALRQRSSGREVPFSPQKF